MGVRLCAGWTIHELADLPGDINSQLAFKDSACHWCPDAWTLHEDELSIDHGNVQEPIHRGACQASWVTAWQWWLRLDQPLIVVPQLRSRRKTNDQAGAQPSLHETPPQSWEGARLWSKNAERNQIPQNQEDQRRNQRTSLRAEWGARRSVSRTKHQWKVRIMN